MTQQFSLCRDDLDARLERFEASWCRGNAPRIEDFLPPANATPEDRAARGALLLELIMIDLERRWRRPSPRDANGIERAAVADRAEPPDLTTLPDRPLLEDYLQRFPELGESAECLPSEVIADEYRVRCRWGDRPMHESYLRRFPRDPTRLQAALVEVDRLVQRSENWAEPWPRAFGEYTLLAEIARGGMGVVYKAHHGKLNRIVALKMVLSGSLASEADIERFYGEARAAAHLDHPGIVPVHEVGQHAGQHYLSMGYIDGESLSEQLAAGPFTPRHAAEIVRESTKAVAHAHGEGIIHRDLKPANIILDRMGRPRLTDFGLAKRVEGESGLTATGQVLGTPSFMPPEQAAGNTHQVGPASDVYALGAVLYNLITGRPPFQAATAIDTLLQVVEQQPIAPRRLSGQIPRDLETICLKCLEKSPERRYASAEALGDDLQRYLDGVSIQARAIGPISRSWRWAHRHRAVASLTFLLGLLACCFVVGITIAFSMLKTSHRQAILARDTAVRESRRANQEARKSEENLDRYRREAEAKEAAQRRAIQALEAKADALAQAEREKKRADDENLRAERESSLRAAASRGRALALEQSEWSSYQEGIVSAELALREGNASAAEEYLGRCPAAYRSWEWRYLKRLCTAGSGAIHFSGSSYWDLIAHRSAVNDVAVSPDGKLLATACQDGSLRVFDPQRGTTVFEKGVSGSPLHAVVFGSKGRLLAAAGAEDKISVWDWKGGKELLTLPSGKSGTFALLLGKVGLVAGGGDGTIRSWNLANRKQRVFEPRHQGKVTSLCAVYLPPTPQISGGAILLASVAEDGRLMLWYASGRPATNVSWPSDFHAPVFLYAAAGRGPGGGLYVATKPAGQISHWQLALKDAYAPRQVTVPVPRTVRDEEGERRNVVELRSTVAPFYTGTSIQVVPGDAFRGRIQGKRFAVSPDRNVLAVATGSAVTVWDANSAERVREFSLHDVRGAVTGMVWSPDGEQLAVASRDGKVRIRNLTEHAARHRGAVQAIAFSPANDRFASAGADLTVKLWDGPQGKLIDSLRHTAIVHALCFAPDGRWLATGSGDGFVQLWDVSSTEARSAWSLNVHPAAVVCVAFSPDGRQVASADADKGIVLQAVDSSSEPRTLGGLGGKVSCLAYSPDGRMLAAGSTDGRITLWDLELGSAVSVSSYFNFRTLRPPDDQGGQVPEDRDVAAGPASTHPAVQLARVHEDDAQARASQARSLAFAANGQLLAFVTDRAIHVWRKDSDMSGTTQLGISDAQAMCLSQDGKRLFVSTAGGAVKVVDTRTGQPLLTLAGPSRLNCLALNRTGSVLAAGGSNGEIRVWTTLPAEP